MTYISSSPVRKQTTKSLKAFKTKKNKPFLQMLTCYDFQTAQLLNQSDVDMILVGDSLGNVVLGYETTVEVTLEEMKIFGAAVKRGAKDKFVIVDLPFGSYTTFEQGIASSVELFKSTKCEAVKLEGAEEYQLEIIKRLTSVGVPVMGHIGLKPQSVHQLGGYFYQGKDHDAVSLLIQEAKALEEAGAFSVVLECVKDDAAKLVTEAINIPTIGIGAGKDVDGQVLVINDLLKMGPETPPKFCTPVADLYQTRKELIDNYLRMQ
jgi:3-methyl-2-oxobutanoate hydroxymethyltransferase